MFTKLALAGGLLAIPQLASATTIGSIQGTGTAARPGSYAIEGIVTAVYANLKPAGFYVQDEAASADGNPATSDAIFVIQTDPTVAVGAKVRVTGMVKEDAAAPSFNQAVMSEAVVSIVDGGHELPPFVTLKNASFSAADLERYEGMRVQFSDPLTVTDIYNLKLRGEMTLSTAGIAYQATQFIDPNDKPSTGTHSTGTSNLAAVNAYQAANERKAILLDDGSAASNPKPIPYLDATLQTVRVGSTVARLRGILGYGFGKWRIQPLAGADAPVLKVTRPLRPPAFGPLDLKLASFNVLNYFNGDGAGGGFPTARGAKNPVDFSRQRSKIIVALGQMDADVVGLTEIENDGTSPTSAIQDLVSGLNQYVGADTYAFVDDGGATRQPHNTDVIHCAIIYKPAVVAPLGPALVANAPGVFERPPLAQLFITRRKARADTLGFVVNHFKSKGSGSGANADQHDGQGGSNARRRDQAKALVQFINKTVIPAGASKVVSAGDYNANYEEDPLDILRADGLVPATPPSSASYVYKGLTGSLDHAVLTPNLIGFLDVQKWHINSPEPYFLEYDVAGESTAVNSPFRCSDHDPVLIGVNFAGMSNAASSGNTRLFVYPNPPTGQKTFSLASVPASAGLLTLDFSLPQGARLLSLHGPVDMIQSQLSRYTSNLAPGIYVLKLSGKGFHQTQRVMKE
jgi:predicted extracellular nuclease